MLALAVNIAQRMGIHNEASISRYTPFEAEMRRRLWWALVSFDARVGELSESKVSNLNPTWDCKLPLNVNESSLWPEMKVSPDSRDNATEAIFIVTRSEHGEYLRNAGFNCDFSNPALKLIAKSYGDMNTWEKRIQEQYLKFCDQENSLHCMALWMSSVQLSKCHLLESYAKNVDSSTKRTAEVEAEACIQHAFRMLECDTNMLTSSLTRGYTWIIAFYFPFPAYIHLVQEMAARPTGNHTEKAWELMNKNYEARFPSEDSAVDGLFRVFASMLLKGWEIMEKSARESGDQLASPKIIQSINRRLQKAAQRAASAPAENDTGSNTEMSDVALSMPVDIGDNLFYGMGGQSSFAGVDPRLFLNMAPGQLPAGDMTHFNWASMVWEMRNSRGW